jgi:exosortase/archaeosortase family protein
MLLLLPLVVTVDDLFALAGSRLGLDQAAAGLTPIEAALAAALLQVLGVDAAASGSRLVTSAGGLHQTLVVAWNCSGWQAFLLLVASFGIGLRREQPLLARIEVAALGLVGTLLCNVLRIAAVAFIAARFGYVPALLFHDYGGVLLGVAWLFLFWEVAYRYVLSEAPSAITMSVSA